MRRAGPAILAGGWALQQLWMFWVVPLIIGAFGGGIYRTLFGEWPIRHLSLETQLSVKATATSYSHITFSHQYRGRAKRISCPGRACITALPQRFSATTPLGQHVCEAVYVLFVLPR